MRTSLITLFIALVAAFPVAAAEISGDWKLEGSIGQFPVDIVCSLKEADSKLTGVCKGADIGELALAGDTDGKTVKWSYEVNFQGQQFTIVYTATLDSATSMKGTISVMGNPSGSFTGKKQ